ncbi:uncharacterized protein LOC123227285 isoform X2 [Mangifera indica]|uniref:uncharacterized protein LOC123227285 isoform X2 n=1 Tax=Mangifera indica TaxID=29780 RepID=UPI001CFADA5A|nr:uncharacterized protein LOC123227285 isoform X2 [Mangifera indica]
MGGLLHFFNFNQSGMARKILAHKKHADGLEAPRNSLELHVENSNAYPAGRDVPYSYPLEEDRSEKSSYPTEASMKKLINEEISKQSNPRRSAPSIVARLMGMDVLQVDTKTVEKKNEHAGSKVSKKNGRSSIDHFSFKTDSSRHTKLDSIYHSEDRDADRWSNGENFGRPGPREHPLEEELQKFKEEFVAWQAARFRECSKIADFVSMPRQWPAQENLNGEKMAIYANSQANASEKLVESKSRTLKLSSHDRDGLQHHKHKVESFPIEQKESTPLRRRSKSVDFEQSSMLNYELDTVPSKIVLLKPGPDMIYDHNEPWTSSMGTLEERSSIEDFLKEVKDRLKCELQGKTLRKGSVVRGSGIETPFSEKPSKPKQIVQHTAKHAREKATRDLGMNLLSSESTRSCISEIQFNGPGSPEFINRDTRRFLSERLRNVQREMLSEVPQVVRGRSRSSLLDYRRVGLRQSGDTSKAKNEWNSWEIERNEQEMQTSSFRHGDDNGVLNRELSPRNLIRSLSAPVSGTSFGQLLLEDRHILTGAQIRRKHEAIDNDLVDVRQRKKDRFNFREKVSNFRHIFPLRRMLFGRKIQSMTEFHGTEYNPAKDILSGPTVIMNFSERHENSTEVPPSPASVCSSSQEEFWRPVDYLSPISTPDVTLGEEISMTQVFRQINSTLNELRRQLNQLDNRPEDIDVEQDQTESEIIDLDDRAEAYIRDLLVASGFYDGSSDKSLFTWDPLAQPISNSVFEKVEESQRKLAGENEILLKDLIEEKGDRKMLLDLLNEALSKLLGPPVTKSKFRRRIINYSLLPPPCGRKLLESVWEIIRICLYPPTDRSYFSLHSLVADDLGSTLWSGLMDEEISALGREVECHIIGDLVEEIFKDMQL